MSFLKITDPIKREQKVKEYAELRNRVKDNFRRERIGESDYKVIFQNFLNRLLKHKKPQQGRLQKNLNLLKRVSKIYQKLLYFHPFLL